MFYHSYLWFVVSSGVSFFAEAWPTKALLRAYRPTTACLGDRVQALAALDKPRWGACINFFYASPSAHSDEQLERQEVAKKNLLALVSTHRKVHQAL